MIKRVSSSFHLTCSLRRAKPIDVVESGVFFFRLAGISLATSLISIAVLVLIHTKKKQDDLTVTLDLPAHYTHQPAELRTSQIERSSQQVRVHRACHSAE
jgi:hypothetical protein